jgi:hypothetical protein
MNSEDKAFIVGKINGAIGFLESLIESNYFVSRVDSITRYKEHLQDALTRLNSSPPAESQPGQEPVGKTPVVCLCGSGRFREAFEKAEFDETLAGKIVLTIGCNTKDIARDVDLEHHKPMLDALHLRKIDMSDEVLVLNVGGYIGESTRREIDYATLAKIPIRYLEAVTNDTQGERSAESASTPTNESREAG